MTTVLSTYANAGAQTHTISLGTPTAGRDVFVFASGANGFPSPPSPWTQVSTAGNFYLVSLYRLAGASNDGTITSLELTYTIPSAPRSMSAVVWEDDVDGTPVVASTRAVDDQAAATTVPVSSAPVTEAQSYDVLALLAGVGQTNGSTVPDETGWVGAAVPTGDSGDLIATANESSRSFLGVALDPGPVTGFSPELLLSGPYTGSGAGLVLFYNVTDVTTPTQQEDFNAPTAPRPTAVENALTGDNVSAWRPAGAGDLARCAYAWPYDLDIGTAATEAERTVDLYVDSTNGTVIDIYRLGWYGGTRSRRVARLPNTPTTQPAPQTIPDSNGATECSNWTVTAGYVVPQFSSPGVYVARVLNPAGTNSFLAEFVVADSSRQLDVLVLRSSNTGVGAYNYFGTRVSPLTGDSLYGAGGPLGIISQRKLAQSYRRPIVTNDGVRQTSLWGTESAFIAWCERQGFSTGYCSDRQLDAGFISTLITAGRAPRVFVLVGHPEYWTDAMRAELAAARAAGVHILVLGANELFWRSRYGATATTPVSTPGDRSIMWCHKDSQPGPDTHVAGTALDPVTWTGTYSDPRQPTPALPTGSRDGTINDVAVGSTLTFFRLNGINYFSATIVASTYGTHPLWRGTTVATGTDLVLTDAIGFEADVVDLAPGDQAQLAGATVVPISGEFSNDRGDVYTLTDADLPDPTQVGLTGPEPSTPGDAVLDWGIVCQWQSLASEEQPNLGSLMVDVGTANWPALLDDDHWRFGTTGSLVVEQAQQATVNLLVDMGAAPAGVQAGLVVPEVVEPLTHAGLTVTEPVAPTVPDAQPNLSVTVAQAPDAVVSPTLVRRSALSRGPLRLTVSRDDGADLDLGTTEICVVSYTAEPAEVDWLEVTPDESGTDAIVGVVLGPVGSGVDVERGPGRYRLGLRAVVGTYRQVWFTTLSLY